MTATVTKLQQTVTKTENTKKGKKPVIRRTKQSVTNQQRVGYATLTIAGVLTFLSLSHLAHGVSIVTHAPTWEAWAMAIGIDLGFLSCEAACVLVTDQARAMVNRFAKPTVIATMLGSAVMNAYAFTSTISGIDAIPAILLGAAIPALIYSLTRIGIALCK